MALGLEKSVACFFKNSFHSYQTKNLSACVASEPSSGLAWVGWEAVHAGKKQPLQLNHRIEMNDISEYYSIQRHCCSSHLHATIKVWK